MNPRFGPFEVDLGGQAPAEERESPLRFGSSRFRCSLLSWNVPARSSPGKSCASRLWPSDTFVDFEVALNSAVSRLRDALVIPPTHPSVIETIPKRGYRFVAPIPIQPAVAVMPFANQTGDANDEYFSDGLTDELIRVLSRIECLRVTAPSVVFRFKRATS